MMERPISVCIITKNESEMLNRCLKSLKTSGFELVIVDTGSTDDTVRMAKDYTDSVYEFEWIDDFAAARNYSVQKAKNDIVLCVDSDEAFLEGDVDGFVKLAQSHTDAVGEIKQREYTMDEKGEMQESVIPLLRAFDRRKFHFAGRIHEQVVRGSVFDSERDDSREMLERRRQDTIERYETGLLFDHRGYAGSKEERQKKAKRNVELLKKDLDEYPDSPDLLYQMAKSVYVAEGAEASIPYYERALSCDLDPGSHWVRDLINCYGYVLLELERYEQALSLEAVYEDLRNSADYVFLMGLIHMNNMMFDRASEEFIRCTQMKEDQSVGTNSFKAYYNAGVIEECLGHTDKAKDYYKKAGDYAPAVSGLGRLS